MENLVFVTLTPANALAKLAFSDAYDMLAAGCQEAAADGDDTLAIARTRMSLAKSQQEYDGDVLRYKLEMERRTSQSNSEASDMSLTEPDTDVEKEMRQSGMIWIGCFHVGFEPSPSDPEMGWTVGKSLKGGNLSGMSSLGKNLLRKGTGADMLLCTRHFAKKYGIDLRDLHARLNFAPDNRALFIAGCSRSQLAQPRVNGHLVERGLFALNQYTMRVGFDRLEYILQYTDYAETEAFRKMRARYFTNFLSWAPQFVPFEMPTPPRNTRLIGRWVLGQPLGKGIQGRVFLATNTKNEIAAVKIVERTCTTAAVAEREITTNTAVTDMAQRYDGDGRIVRQIEVLYLSGEEFSFKRGAFDEVAIVLQPMTPQTLDDMIRSIQGGRRAKYGRDVAEEWPIGRTPSPIKRRRKRELKRLVAEWDIDFDIPSDSSTCTTPISSTPSTPSTVPTPLLSINETCGEKRRQISDEDPARPAKIRATSSNTFDMIANESRLETQRKNKTRVIATATATTITSPWAGRLRSRPMIHQCNVHQPTMRWLAPPPAPLSPGRIRSRPPFPPH